MADRPHIVIFNPDQWRGDMIGYAGDRSSVTPVLDGLVSTEAVGFDYAFCQNPVCTPSRCSFMSGWYPHVGGHRTMFHMQRPPEPVLLKTLKDAGHFVWWGGKNDLVPGQDGYDDYCNLKYRPPADMKLSPGTHSWTDWRGEPGGDNFFSFYCGKLESKGYDGPYRDGDWANVLGAVDFIGGEGKRMADEGTPLVIYLPIGYPHPPYAVEDPWYSGIDRSQVKPRIPTPEPGTPEPSMISGIRERQGLGGWTEDRWTELRATYQGMCSRVDHQLGLVADALRGADLWDDTALFFFSDHGDFTGDYGLVEKNQNTFQDCLTRVPLVIKPPKDIPVEPRVTPALAELIDFPATVEALSGITPGHTHFGRSLLPVVAGETDEHRDAVFCEGGRIHGEEHCMEKESSSNQEPGGLYWPRVNLQTSEGPEHTKAVMCRTATHKYVRRLYEPDELYDLKADPGETVNLIDDPSTGGVLGELKDRMLTFFLETGDVVPHDPDRRG